MTVLSADIGGTNFRLGAVEEDGSVVKYEKRPTAAVFSLGRVLKDLEQAIREFAEGISFDAIAIGFPATLNRENVASQFNYSVPHCSRLIRDETGIGFVAFVRRIKMNHAAALLLNTRTSVADIANMVGYENPESFIRVFQKVYQMPPTAYRKKRNGEQGSV